MCRKKHSITSQPVKAIPELIVKSRKINSPAIIYSRKVLNDNLNIFLSSLKTVNNKVHLLYAVKACTNSEVIREMATKVTGFSVSSDEEYNLVQRYNKVISATGFGYRRYPQNENSIAKLTSKLIESKQFNIVSHYLLRTNINFQSQNYGLNEALLKSYDGILFDYNSYKLQNGSTHFLNNLNVTQENGYIKTNAFGETKVSGLFAVGSVTMPISGVPEAIYSGQVTGLYVGHLLEKTTIADPSGRFPFLPREENWKSSFQHKLEQNSDGDA